MNSLHVLVDTHAHLADPRLHTRLTAVLDAAHAAGVAHLIAVATTASDSQVLVDLAREHPTIRASVGIHPNEAVEANESDWATVEQLARSPEVVALGETGLDRHWDRTPWTVQQAYFTRHLELADRVGLPVIIHSRACHRELVDHLQDWGRPVRGVAHSFTGTWDEASELLALGLYISFAGMLTFANKSLDSLRQAAARIPADRLLVETDAPYLSPVPHRGQENEPARVVHTAAKLAAVRGVTLAELADLTTANAHALFQRRPV